MLLLKLGVGLVDFIEGAYLVQRQTDNSRLFGQGLQYGLTNPPNRIGNELETTCFIELFGGFNQTQVAFVDEVGQTESLVLILLCNRHHESQVGLGQLLKSSLVAFLNPLRQFHFFLYGYQFFTTNFLKILIQRGAFAIGDRKSTRLNSSHVRISY